MRICSQIYFGEHHQVTNMDCSQETVVSDEALPCDHNYCNAHQHFITKDNTNDNNFIHILKIVAQKKDFEKKVPINLTFIFK